MGGPQHCAEVGSQVQPHLPSGNRGSRFEFISIGGTLVITFDLLTAPLTCSFTASEISVPLALLLNYFLSMFTRIAVSYEGLYITSKTFKNTMFNFFGLTVVSLGCSSFVPLFSSL